MWPPGTEKFEQIVDLMIPRVLTAEDRLAFIGEVFSHQRDFRENIEIDGTTRHFAERLLIQTNELDSNGNNKHWLRTLLETLKNYKGIEDRDSIDRIILILKYVDGRKWVAERRQELRELDDKIDYLRQSVEHYGRLRELQSRLANIDRRHESYQSKKAKLRDSLPPVNSARYVWWALKNPSKLLIYEFVNSDEEL